jgi:choice-of-anchor B domain-containing protein
MFSRSQCSRSLLVGGCVLLAACSGSDAVDPGAAPSSLTIAPSEQTVNALGGTTRLTAEVRSVNGSIVRGPVVSWARRGTGATTVSDSGVVTIVANGVDTVIATSGALTGRAVITVNQTAASITLSPATTVLAVLGATQQLNAAVLDANGRVVSSAAPVWSSSNSAVLAVTANGLVTASRPGASVITATFAGLSATRNVNVTLDSPVGGPLLGATIPCAGGMAGPFPCENVDLLAFLPVSGLGGGSGVDLNDLWGWTDATTGKEYAIVMRRDGTAFVDVTSPTNPIFLGSLPITQGATPNTWHDVKVYQDHAFIVADAAGPHGMQVFDLRRLRDHAGVPRTFTPDATYRNVNSAHNIAINEESGFAYIVGASGGGSQTCGGAIHMVDIRSPTSPTFAGCFADSMTGRVGNGYTHDVQCVRYRGPDTRYTGREICLGSNQSHLSIADVTDKQAPKAISRASYPQVAYAHQGWFTEDQRHFLMNDESDEFEFGLRTRTMIWDVADLEDPILVGEYLGPNPSTDHNHYIRGSRMYASTYQFGLRVVDVSNPRVPAQIGYFDTAPNFPNTAGFGGSWSNYPYFQSGIIVMTSRTEGFFVLRLRQN